MSAKVIALRLNKVCRYDLATVAIEERKRCAERGSWNAPEDGLSDDPPPTRLRLVHRLVEEVVEEERLKLVRLGIGRSDVVEEDRLG